MNKLLETIKIVNGSASWLEFHNERLNDSRQILFNSKSKIDLKNFIQPPSQIGTCKCRVIYSDTIVSIVYSHYQARNFNFFKIVEADNLVYDFKYLNRENLNRLCMLKGQTDDILIIKQGFVTDTSIANVAFWYQDKWLTPSTPLLKGTTRERLLRKTQIVETDIQLTDLKNFSKMALMNALIEYYVVEDFKFHECCIF